MYSATEERLSVFIDRITTAITGEDAVVIEAGDNWEVHPNESPKRLVYALADVASMGDRILGMLAHEVAEIIHTGPYGLPWDSSKRPKAAKILVNVVNDARIEREFARSFSGATSLFEEVHGEGPNGMWTPNILSGFSELEIKWRFLLNVDRALHGLPPLGDQRDQEAINRNAQLLNYLAGANSTQELVNDLEPIYLTMIDLMRQEQNEKRREQRKQQQEAEDEEEVELEGEAATPGDKAELEVDEDEKRVSYFDHDAAEYDDGEPGGEDGSPGMREDGIGEGEDGAPGEHGESDEEFDVDSERTGGAHGNVEGEGFDDEDQEPTLDPDFGEREIGDEDDGTTDISQASDDWSFEDDEELKFDDRFKATNLIDEMLDDSKAKSKTLDSLRYKLKQRMKEARAIAKRIERERDAVWSELAESMGMDKANKKLRSRMLEYHRGYETTRREMRPHIFSLKRYVESVLRDNDRDRYGGSYETGQRFKKDKLFRVGTQSPPKIFENRELIGGKSYAFVLVIDQSTSQMGQIQRKCFETALIAAEAMDGLVDTAIVGFTDYRIKTETGRARRQYRVFKRFDDVLKRRRPAMYDLTNSYGGTPMVQGVAIATRLLEQSKAEVKAIIVISDGYPNDLWYNNGAETRLALRKARLLGISTFGLYVNRFAGRKTGYQDKAEDFYQTAFDRYAPVTDPKDVAKAVNRVIRGVVRRRPGRRLAA